MAEHKNPENEPSFLAAELHTFWPLLSVARPGASQGPRDGFGLAFIVMLTSLIIYFRT
ncbi:hypothetical protein BofuT4_uP117070.1 [Botrytis cinerea T4]|uniref:Uncharacterized protein n=1 Tax=Botryotinia fuckeliana (strain T4) TaxID=999810 RepID=G2Y0J2_BOTF4|nr:hypothetical protein BofuT4_uP117070.1 [Botrytis cinerea T4]